jgi:RNA polymerase sigma-70 factor (ECF subfamily)
VTRARVRLANGRRRQVGTAEQQRFVDAFVDAGQTGDLTTLERLLAAEVDTSSPVAIAA